MPWCPKCKNEYVEGIVKCADCGSELVEELPVKTKKKPRTAVDVTVLLVKSPAGWLVMKRPEKGLLAGLWQPLTVEKLCTEEEMMARAETLGIRAEIISPLPAAKHIFTHVEWTLCGWIAQTEEAVVLPEGYAWMGDMDTYSIPSASKAL